MKDTVRDVGAITPAIAVIKASKRGDLIVSTISVRDRLIKNCIACNIKKIYVISSEENIKPPYIEHANELSSKVEYITSLQDARMTDNDHAIYIEDGYLVHTSLLDDFLTSGATNLRNPLIEKNIFSKDSFKIQQAKQYSSSENFVTVAFDALEITENNHQEVQSRLFKWLNKKTDGYISQKLNRPVSTFISKFFANYPIHPMYFTGLTAIIAALMIYVLLTGGEAGILWGCLLFHVASVADGIDGEIARAKFQASLHGAKIDTTVDMITNILFMGGMSYALWSTYGEEYLTLGLYIVALAVSGVSLMTMLLYFGPGGGRFDILASTIRQRFEHNSQLLKIFNFCNYFLKRDAFAFLFALYGVLGLGRYIPEFLIFGLVIWNLAIITNAKSILRLKSSASEA